MEILPRLHGVEVKEEDRELALELAEHIFPDVTHIDELGKQEKAWWILIAGKLLRGDDRYIEAFSRVFQPSVEANVDDVLKRQEFDFNQKRRRAAMEEVERLNREERENKKLEVELKREAQRGEEDKDRHKQDMAEREGRWKNTQLKEWLAMGMAAITFLCAVAGFLVGLFSGDLLVVGGSSGACVAALVTLVKLLLPHHDQPPPQEPPPSGEVSAPASG
ncbi:MAG: hypothetical protein M3335_00145 [Actinomycetota bacterium]|nr:hypothetical protein [Actinomycetota bacterium]